MISKTKILLYSVLSMLLVLMIEGQFYSLILWCNDKLAMIDVISASNLSGHEEGVIIDYIIVGLSLSFSRLIVINGLMLTIFFYISFRLANSKEKQMFTWLRIAVVNEISIFITVMFIVVSSKSFNILNVDQIFVGNYIYITIVAGLISPLFLKFMASAKDRVQ